MTTSKPFSTISYNSNEFFETRTNELIDNGILDFVFYIEHAPEDDELKAHKHCYFVPSGKCDTNKIKSYLEEFDEKHPDKPLGCTIFVSSKFDDAYLYFVHDEAYLARKGQKRKYHYTFHDIRTSDVDHLREMVNRIDRSSFIGTERVINAVKGGVAFEQLVALGSVPIQLINQYKMAYDMISTVYRNGRETHTPNFDENGELIEQEKKEKKAD